MIAAYMCEKACIMAEEITVESENLVLGGFLSILASFAAWGEATHCVCHIWEEADLWAALRAAVLTGNVPCSICTAFFSCVDEPSAS